MLRIFLAIWIALVPTLSWAGSMTLLGAGGLTPAAGFTGTGDVVGNWVTWYGLYAFSAATRGGKAVQLCDASTAGNCTDMLTDATTGLLVLTLVNGVTDCTVSTCWAGKWYDQSGTTNCTTACDFTFTNRPIFIASCAGTRPCLEAVTGGNTGPTISSTKTQPFSLTVVVKGINTAVRQCAYGVTSGNVRTGISATSGSNYIFAGTAVITATASDSAFHAMSSLFNGASSKISIDGGSTSVATPGTQNWASGQTVSIFGCGDNPSTNKVFLTEAGTNSTDISANYNALYTAQKANAGF